MLLPGEMLIATAQATRDLLAPCFAAPTGDVVLDGGAVTRIDAAGLQVLLACARAAREAGVRVSISPCSAVLAQALEISGAARRFDLPVTGGAR
jgi:anti-anti-sigma factor